MQKRSPSRTSTALAVVGALLLLPALSHAEAGDAGAPRGNPAAMAFDLILLRPLWLVATAVGTVLFVPMGLISAPQGWEGGSGEAFNLMVAEPAKNVFQRPLGDF